MARPSTAIIMVLWRNSADARSAWRLPKPSSMLRDRGCLAQHSNDNRSDAQSLIDGGPRPSTGNGRRAIINPATLEQVDDVTEAGAADVEAACIAASDAWRHWRRMPALERGKLLHETAEPDARRPRGAFEAAHARRRQAADREPRRSRVVARPASSTTPRSPATPTARRFRRPPSIRSTSPSRSRSASSRAIVPFNYPLLLLVWKIAPGAGRGQHGRHQAVRADAARDAADGRALRWRICRRAS